MDNWNAVWRGSLCLCALLMALAVFAGCNRDGSGEKTPTPSSQSPESQPGSDGASITGAPTGTSPETTRSPADKSDPGQPKVEDIREKF